MKKVFINGKCMLDNDIIEGYSIFFNEKVASISSAAQSYNGVEIIDLKGKYLFPGFVDVHVHGAGGADIMDGTHKALNTISKQLAKSGVTKFLATTMTMPLKDIYNALDVVKQAMHDNSLEGAKPIGVHLEGPYISVEYMGAQNPKYIKAPNWQDIEHYTDIIKIITLAVEEDINYQFIKNNPGIKLSIGHTNATFEQALETFDLGVTHCTHCFNAMTGLHHRKPGVVGATFTKPYETEFIADGVHIHPGFLDTFVNIIGKERAILITDSMRAGGMSKGKFDLGGQCVIVDETSARLEDGTLAGSILTLDQAVRNMLMYTDYSLASIINMATLNPAKSIESDIDLGAIKVGYPADFVIMNEALIVESTWVDGRCVYEREG